LGLGLERSARRLPPLPSQLPSSASSLRPRSAGLPRGLPGRSARQASVRQTDCGKPAKLVARVVDYDRTSESLSPR
jgi:hypothetical protein